jgi:hypothetical protein
MAGKLHRVVLIFCVGGTDSADLYFPSRSRRQAYADASVNDLPALSAYFLAYQ